MRRVILFAEDYAHETFISALVNNMNIQRAMNTDVSFKKFITDENEKFAEWRK